MPARISIPSPHGTNKSGLFFPYHSHLIKSGFAYDAILGDHPVDNPSAAEGKIGDALRTLMSVAKKMDRQSWLEFCADLHQQANAGAEDDIPVSALEKPRSEGMRQATDAMAFDHTRPRQSTQERRFASKFPGASRIGTA